MSPSFDDIQHAMNHFVAGEVHHASEEQKHSSTIGEAISAGIMEAALSTAFELAAEAAMGLVMGSVGLASSSSHGHSTSSVGTLDGHGFTHQTTAFTCAVVSQKMILDQFHVTDPATGEPISEALLVYEAATHGWLDDHGTSIANMGKLLEHHGISSHHGHDWHHLVEDLSHGHQVLIAVNADYLWSNPGHASPLLQLFGAAPNHALVVKGVKVDPHGHVQVIVNDPGQPNGAGVEYPLEQFQTALGGGNFHYVATDHAPPGWSPSDQVTEGLQGTIPPSELGFDSVAHGIPEESFVDSLDSLSDEQRLDLIRSI